MSLKEVDKPRGEGEEAGADAGNQVPQYGGKRAEYQKREKNPLPILAQKHEKARELPNEQRFQHVRTIERRDWDQVEYREREIDRDECAEDARERFVCAETPLQHTGDIDKRKQKRGQKVWKDSRK
jgi:hypothetical protein